MSERLGILAAILSSALGGMATAGTRFVLGGIDPVTLAAFRFGGAAAFYLWVFALERTTPTRVANTMTINPLAASLLAAFLPPARADRAQPAGRIGGGRAWDRDRLDRRA